MLVCIQPLSQYKRKDLYKYVESFELADPSFFEDAVITENLCICTLKKECVDKYVWLDLTLKSVDQKYIEYYKWNIKYNKGLHMTQKVNMKPENFDVNLDFIESSRLCSPFQGGGFGQNGFGYRWNVLYDNSSMNAGIGHIHFTTKQAKDNFCKYWYNGKRGESLASKVVLGMHIISIALDYYFFIPQIDWKNISNNPLWKAGNYDDAVLSEMSLKWNADKTVIIKDE